jgi:cytochrome c-type biogenesis protein CcmH/NrfG
MRLQVTARSELDALRAERDAWRTRAESALRVSGRGNRRSRASRSRAGIDRFLATSLVAAIVVLGAVLLLGRQEAAGARDYPGCIGKARYEHPIEGNQYQELVNALYACEVYRTG